MASVSPTVASALAPARTDNSDNLRDVGVDDFLKLLITELQNQDPLEPTDNGQILEQVGQIRNIQATTQLSQTLESVLMGQNLSSASGLVGKRVSGLTDSGDAISGQVDRVTIDGGLAKLIVQQQAVSLANVKEILAN